MPLLRVDSPDELVWEKGSVELPTNIKKYDKLRTLTLTWCLSGSISSGASTEVLDGSLIHPHSCSISHDGAWARLQAMSNVLPHELHV